MKKFEFPTRLVILLLLVTGAGMSGVYERFVHEHANTAGTQPVPWGLWIAAYTFFSGISAGAFPVAAMPFLFGNRRFRPLVPTALLVALVGLVTAMIFVLVDLGRPEKAWHALRAPNFDSVMTWVIWLYSGYGALLAAMLWFVLRPDWAQKAKETGSRIARLLAFGWEASSRQEKRDRHVLVGMSVVGLAMAMSLAGGVGSLFAVLGGRSFWHSSLFPVAFLVSALLSGGSIIVTAATLLGRGGYAFKTTLLTLSRYIGALLIVEMVIIPAEALIVIKGGIPSHVAVLKAIAAGPFPWIFWVVQLGLGTLLAAGLIFIPKRRSLTVASIAALLVLLGVFAFRLNFVIPQMMPTMEPVGTSLHIGEDYVPNLLEWNIVVFGIGFAALTFLAGCRWLPILSERAPVQFELAAREPEDFTELGDALQPSK